MRIVQIAQQTAPEAHMDPIGWLTSRLLINLTQAQADAILAAIAKFGQDRPNPTEYNAVEKKLMAIPIPQKVDRKKGGGYVDNVSRGYDENEVRLLPGFDAKRDLPEGWGLYSMYDGGANHRIDNAARIAWTQVWNFWSHYVEGGKDGR